jgi:hypothetical protein
MDFKPIGVLAAVLICSFLGMAVLSLREQTRDANCRCHLGQIALALSNYHEAYGCYPPASAVDNNGKPAHSWRVLTLLQEKMEWPEPYFLDEPWDGPRNRLRSTHPYSALFHCPSGNDDASGMTDFVAVTGPSTAWPSASGLKRGEIKDDPASTILVLEVARSGIGWMAPADVALEDLLARGLHGNHRGHVNAIFADGKVRRVRTNVSRATLRGLLTIDGGERLEPSSWESR